MKKVNRRLKIITRAVFLIGVPLVLVLVSVKGGMPLNKALVQAAYMEMGLVAYYLVAELWQMHRQTEKEAYTSGYEYARDLLHPAGSYPNEYDPKLVERLHIQASGVFNSNEREHAFDRGIRDAVTAYEREHGAP